MSYPSPDVILKNWNGMIDNDFQLTIRKTFNLPDKDEYAYATESFQMTLAQVKKKMETEQCMWSYRSPDRQTIPVRSSFLLPTAY